MLCRGLLLNDNLLARPGGICKGQRAVGIGMPYLMFTVALGIDVEVGVGGKTGNSSAGILGNVTIEMPPGIIRFETDDGHAGKGLNGAVVVGVGVDADRPSEGIADRYALALRAFIAFEMGRLGANKNRDEEESDYRDYC